MHFLKLHLADLSTEWTRWMNLVTIRRGGAYSMPVLPVAPPKYDVNPVSSQACVESQLQSHPFEAGELN